MDLGSELYEVDDSEQAAVVETAVREFVAQTGTKKPPGGAGASRSYDVATVL